MAFRFDRDESGIEDVTTGPDVAPVLDEVAKEAESAMKRIAARHAADSFMGYRDSIKRIPAGPTGEGVAAFVGSDSPAWHLEEFGTARSAPGSTLRRGIRETGIRFEEGR